MTVGLIILYILVGILVFIMSKLAEDYAKYDDPEWYASYYKKPKIYRISVRLCRIIFWPSIIIVIVLYVLYIGVKYFYKNLIE